MPKLIVDTELQKKINTGEINLTELLKEKGFCLTNIIEQKRNEDDGFIMTQ